MKAVILIIIAVTFSIKALALEIKSSAFENKGYIPDRYTCDAQGFSPLLSLKDAPPKTKSFVLIADDPDAPFKTWVHWVMFNIPSDLKELKENISQEELTALGVIEGLNDFGTVGYKGPCPPPGKAHRYFFSLYALDTVLTLPKKATKSEVIEAMKGHILAEAKLTGLYQK